MLYEVHAKAIEVHAFFDSLVDRFLKPITFVLLGAVVPLSVIALPEIVVVGAFSAIMFMFVVRPFVVFVSLSPWMFTKKALLHWREVLFISFLRETGAIAAILILYSFARGLLDVEIIYAIGVWVILYTLILEPPLTPLIAKRLEVVD
jgi:cell volume regulation protein A